MDKGFDSNNSAPPAGKRYRIVKVVVVDQGKGFRWELIEGVEGASPTLVKRASRSTFASWMDAWEAGNAAHMRLRAAEVVEAPTPADVKKT
ncbi:hypothetical protein [Variovorax ginsengisoli]|uniref:Uncharacterized protein n=1 Tax=Variovorax ginsengisoli TaxID=363844 RepID=A0ABT9SH08_9BURK|nr:hypothetical protein [Variovorax ginsengisoli]MDP9902702.1 hypothetical protein [Variovorax ginsengisoli]